ncbi:MAG: DUF4179 domain-containing protein [Romboutsia sp.]
MSNKKYDEIKIPLNIDNSIENGVKQAMSENKTNAKNNHKSIIKAASIAIVGIGIIGATSFGSSSFANEMLYRITNALGIQKDLEDYTTVVNNAITKDGLTITLNEVVLDGNELVVSTTFDTEKEFEDGYINENVDIYIDGEKRGSGYGGGSKAIDKNTIESVINHDIGSSIDGDVDIKIVYSGVIYNEEGKEIKIKDKFVFEFTTNGDNLKLDTNIINFNQKFELGDNETITLNKFTSNSVGKKIYYTRDIHNLARYDLKLVGKDDLGNSIEFYMYRARADYGVFIYDTYYGEFNNNAKFLTLSLYAAKQPETSGKSNSDFKKIGEEFTINLSN